MDMMTAEVSEVRPGALVSSLGAATGDPGAGTPMSAAAKPADNGSAAAAAALAGREFLTFRLGAEEYGIDILRVQEIRSYEQPTRIANAPAFLKGVVNLRGVIVPVIELRRKVGFEADGVGANPVVVVLNVCRRVVGVVVDAVSDVVRLRADQLRPVPEFNSTWDSSHLQAIAVIGDRNLTLVDVEKVMSAPDMGLVDEATSSAG